QLDPGDGGWLGALKDPSLREAIHLMHHTPAHPWTIDELAHASGMSRSLFHQRFRETVGETPREYLTRWRMHVATRLLRDGRSVAATGRQVGYVTEAAFSNAFLRVMGIRPGAYRRAV
ncbi:MAG: helix-turn-helix transcriptional regulator, partial [Acidimicrobiia bacterium]